MREIRRVRRATNSQILLRLNAGILQRIAKGRDLKGCQSQELLGLRCDAKAAICILANSRHKIECMTPVQVPWTRDGSGFTLTMEALIMLLSAEMPVDAMADLLDEHDTRLWRVLMHYVEQAHAKSDWSTVSRQRRPRPDINRRPRSKEVRAVIRRHQVNSVTGVNPREVQQVVKDGQGRSGEGGIWGAAGRDMYNGTRSARI